MLYSQQNLDGKLLFVFKSIIDIIYFLLILDDLLLKFLL